MWNRFENELKFLGQVDIEVKKGQKLRYLMLWQTISEEDQKDRGKNTLKGENVERN